MFFVASPPQMQKQRKHMAHKKEEETAEKEAFQICLDCAILKKYHNT